MDKGFFESPARQFCLSLYVSPAATTVCRLMTATQPPGSARDAARRFVGVPFRAQTYRNLAYLAVAFPLGLAAFVAVAVGLSASLGLLITWVGLPVLVATVTLATLVAAAEATLATRLLGTDVALPEAVRSFDRESFRAAPGRASVAAVKRLLTAPTTWTSVALVLGKFVYGVGAFAALVTTGSVVASALAAPVYYDHPAVTYRAGTWVVDTLPEAVAVAAGGLVALLVGLHLLNGLARFGGYATAALLAVGGDAAGGDE
jgi:hypothetical protein